MTTLVVKFSRMRTERGKMVKQMTFFEKKQNNWRLRPKKKVCGQPSLILQSECSLATQSNYRVQSKFMNQCDVHSVRVHLQYFLVADKVCVEENPYYFGLAKTSVISDGPWGYLLMFFLSVPESCLVLEKTLCLSLSYWRASLKVFMQVACLFPVGVCFPVTGELHRWVVSFWNGL